MAWVDLLQRIAKRMVGRDLLPVQAVGNTQETLLASSAKTKVTSSDDQGNDYARALRVQVVVDSGDVGFSIVPKIEGKDAAGGYYTILQGAAIVAAGTTTLRVAPWAPNTANVSVADILPAVWRVTVTPTDAKEVTYGVYCDIGI